MRRPFLVFPWDKPFLPELVRSLCTGLCPQGGLGDCVILVPHNRPRRYLLELLRTHPDVPRPTLLPRMLTVTEAVGLFRFREAPSRREAALLDRVALLHQSVQEAVRAGDPGLCAHFAHGGMDAFLPWGMRLAGLFEECFNQNVEVHNIQYAEGEVSPLAAALLGSLGTLFAHYARLLGERGWSTPGLDARNAARLAEQGEPLPPLLQAGTVVIAGFSALNATEDALLHRLWRDGAYVCLHSDPLICSPDNPAGEKPHWACNEHVRWIARWKASTRQAAASSGCSPRLFFTAGHDVHSQLQALRAALPETDGADGGAGGVSSAVVLSNDSLLIPVLHHLPDRDFNVSMGYPLNQAPLCRFIEYVLRLHADADVRDTNTQCHWRDMLNCLRHPCVALLGCAEGEQGEPLATALAQVEEALRTGPRLVDPATLLAGLATDVPPVLAEVFEVLRAFGAARTLGQLADALHGLATLLLTHGNAIWGRYPLDAEGLYRLVQNVIPALKHNALAQEPFSASTLHSLIRSLLAAERVPFEAEPLTALQVLGMLECRLLHFDRLFILDATDDALPGFSAQDPLLPDALRTALGLPDTRHRESIAAYNLFRLMASAREVHFFWQEGVQHSGLFDGRKSRSRFVEECLWREEQRRGELLAPGTGPLVAVACEMHAPKRRLQAPPVTEGLRRRVRAVLKSGLSPSRMDRYIACPARFAWQDVYGFDELDTVSEGDDPAAVGSLIHEVLYTVYADWLGREVKTGDITHEALCATFERLLQHSPLRSQLPADRLLYLRAAAPQRFAAYLDAQPDVTRIVELETKIVEALEGTGQVLWGVLDRVDIRDGKLYVFDYKTGNLHLPRPDVWSDADLWGALADADASGEAGGDLLERIATAFPSVQLPFYLYLALAAARLGHLPLPPVDAALVDLKGEGGEAFLLHRRRGEEVPHEDILTRKIPLLLRCVVRHLERDECFAPREGDACRYCPCTGLCRK